MTTQEVQEVPIEVLYGLNREVSMWREFFLEEMFVGDLASVQEVHKQRLGAYFMAIPSLSFTNPWQEFNKCWGVLLQNIERDKER